MELVKSGIGIRPRWSSDPAGGLSWGTPGKSLPEMNKLTIDAAEPDDS
jgi:hypothetical protein